jgi:Toastrack DUF4097
MIDQTFTTPGPLSLDLMLPGGSIEIETVDGDETHVTLGAEPASALDDAHVELHERRGGHELVVGVGKRLGGFFGGVFIYSSSTLPEFHLRITCPHGAQLAVKTVAADVTARGTFADAKVKSVSGDVELGRVGGDLNATSVSGDLALVADADVYAKAVSGDLRLDAASGSVRVTTVSGDVDVAIRRGSRLHVDADSLAGDLASELDLSDEPGTSEGPLVELKVKTVSGDVRVRRGAEQRA